MAVKRKSKSDFSIDWTAQIIESALTKDWSFNKLFPMTRYDSVTNVKWGFGLKYEADLLVLSKSGVLTEVEIKISRSDLRADFKKRYQHNDERIRYVYYAVPDHLVEYANDILPKEYGIIKLNVAKWGMQTGIQTSIYRNAKKRSVYKATEEDRLKLLRLGCMRFHSRNQKSLDECISKIKNSAN